MAPSPSRLRWQIFALSFTALFLEMMVIRWVPSVVFFVAYYANVMLLSSFLGLGIGAMAAERNWNLFRWFPVLLAGEIITLLHCTSVSLGTTNGEARFDTTGTAFGNCLPLICIFAVNAVVFVPIGEQMGRIFNTLPRLTAYGWDLAGSLCGTLVFGFFSLRYFSPVLGLAMVMALFLSLAPPKRWLFDIPVFAATLGVMVTMGNPAAIWSPYYYITVSQYGSPGSFVAAPPPNLRTMRDPPAYIVKINHLLYHYDLSLDPAAFSPGSREAVLRMQSKFNLPLLLSPGRDRILVVGSGGGCDVEMSLLSGARHVDAVEIDPAIIRLSGRYNASAPYADPRVTVHNDDARAFFARARPGYDLVIFGYLDSHALFSNMTNVRLDGYVYTVESLRSAFGLLNDHGLLSVTFAVTKPWLIPKLYRMMAEATGRTPLLYFNRDDNSLALCASPDASFNPPATVGRYGRSYYSTMPSIDVPTDDWPFLYLHARSIPPDYLVAIGGLLVLSLAAIVSLLRRTMDRGSVHFFMLGMAFLLLETKGISDCSLYFGATWVVTLVVVSGVLLMVIGANLIAGRCRNFSFWLYAPLFAVLLLLYFVPRDQILALSLAGRLAWAVVAVPLPVFFAGIIFSTTFRDAPHPSAAFGANLIGAMVGGFAEYLRMVVGDQQLGLLIIAAYFASLLVLRTSKS